MRSIDLSINNDEAEIVGLESYLRKTEIVPDRI